MVVFLALLLTYWFAVGGTWNGLYHPVDFLFTQQLLAILLIFWAVWRFHRRWKWHKTVLDPVVPFWAAALIISALANRTNEAVLAGLYLAGMYAGIWYVLNDCLHNGLLTRGQIPDALLLGGLPVVAAGLREIGTPWLRINPPLENPNTLAAWLVIILIVALYRGIQTTGLTRWLSFIYAGACFALLVATGSRGAWLALMVAAAVAIYLRLPRRRWVAFGLALPVVVGALWLVAYRGDLGRLQIWHAAVRRFETQPFTGSGPFTFVERIYVGEDQTHQHAHNVVLHVAAELGVLGLLALVSTALTLGKHLSQTKNAALLVLAAGVAAHQLVDLPLFNPTMAVVGILSLLAILHNVDILQI